MGCFYAVRSFLSEKLCSYSVGDAWMPMERASVRDIQSNGSSVQPRCIIRQAPRAGAALAAAQCKACPPR